MTHSVSNSLLLEILPDQIRVATKRKDNYLVGLEQISLNDPEALYQWLKNQPDMYTRVEVCVRTPGFVLVPDAYSALDAEVLFGLNFSLHVTEILLRDPSTSTMEVVYSLNKETYNALREKFPRAIFRHEAAILIDTLFRNPLSDQTAVFVSAQPGSVLLLCSIKGKLQLCNAFPAKTEQEVFYFIMLVYEQLNLQPAETQLVFLGTPPDYLQWEALLSQYIRNLSTRNEGITADEELDTTPLRSSYAMQVMLCG